MPCCARSSSCRRWKPCAPTSPATWARSARPVGARALPGGRRPRGAQGRGGRLVEQRVRCGRGLRRSRFQPAVARAAGGALAHAENRALQGVLEPLLAYRQRLRRGRRHGQAPPLHHGQPLREGRGHVRREQERRAEPLRVQEPAPVRLRAAGARGRAARQRGHPARAQPVRELPVLVHVLHEAGLARGAVRSRPRRRPTRRASNPCRPSRCAIRRSFPTAIS